MINIVNMTKLAAYLESLPEDYEDFAMAEFIRPNDPQKLRNYARNNGGVHTCGTAACAIGHGPAAGILFPAREDDPDMWLIGVFRLHEDANYSRYLSDVMQPNWHTYSREFFTDDLEVWEWCFGSSWSDVDDHHWGAAARIRYALAERSIPSGYRAKPEHVRLYKEFIKCA